MNHRSEAVKRSWRFLLFSSLIWEPICAVSLGDELDQCAEARGLQRLLC
jgi:hypothetical protein